MTADDTPGGGDRAARPGDVGRQIMARRRAMNLSRLQVAERANIAPEYLRYLEEAPAEVDTSTLLRLADALETTTDRLRGVEEEHDTPQADQHGKRAITEDLPPADCWARLRTHGLGRIALTVRDAVEVLPVNYTVVDQTIAYRTTAAMAEIAAEREEVAFEVDHLDNALRQGWSVLAVGPARRVTDRDEKELLDLRAISEPWAGGDRPVWIRIAPRRVTGRRVRAGR